MKLLETMLGIHDEAMVRNSHDNNSGFDHEITHPSLRGFSGVPSFVEKVQEVGEIL